MNLVIDLTPSEEARLFAAAREQDIAPSELARRLVTENLPLLPEVRPVLEGDIAGANVVLESRLHEDETMEPDQIRRLEQEHEGPKGPIY